MNKTGNKRVGPACTPETAPHGCGRPLPVSAAPKTPEELAKLKARLERDTMRVAVAEGVTTLTAEQILAAKILEEKAKAERKAAKDAKAAEKAGDAGSTPTA